MKISVRLFLSLFLALPITRAANASTCAGQTLDHYSVRDTGRCECGAPLNNITATLPPTLKLVGACNLAWPRQPYEKIDIRKSKITFNNFIDGWTPEGHLLLSGKVGLQGVLRVEEGPAGKYWFEPKPRLIRRETPLSSQMSQIGFRDEINFTALRPPKRLLGKECFLVDVSIDAIDMHVVIAQTDENGTFPVQFSLKKANNYRDCQ